MENDALASEPGIERRQPLLSELAVRRALAPRESAYAEEVRKLVEAGLAVMRRSDPGTSPRVADIVREAGLSNQAFYRHFASKEDLVAAIVEDGAHRLASYLAHQMGKAGDAEGKVRRWIEGVMAQAGDPETAHATRAVLWNGGRVRDHVATEGVHHYGLLSELLVAPLGELGSSDPERDAVAVAHAAMGRMNDFLRLRVQPGPADVDHMAGFALRAAGAGRH